MDYEPSKDEVGELCENVTADFCAKMIVKTRQGGKNYPCLYAITWQPIDECRGKNLELGPTKTAPRKFSLELNMTKVKTESLGQKLYQLNTETVSTGVNMAMQ